MSQSTTECRSCGAKDLRMVLSLGSSPLANSLLVAEDLTRPEETFPLELVFCGKCSLVQITETVPPEKMFREYLYFSSFSDTLVQNARSIAERMIDTKKLGPGSLAAEMASNDGYLLQFYKQRGVPVLGIEPARNVAKVAEAERGVRTITEFFGADLGRTLQGRGERCDVFHANNVFAHVADLNGVTAGIEAFLKDDGVAVIETPYVKDLIDHCEFDTIYHEHLFYYSLTAIQRLVTRHGLVVADVERIPMHGGSLRVFLGKRGHAKESESVVKMLADEQAWGVDDPAFYAGFADKVRRLKESLTALLADLRKSGKRIAAYGAAAKGTTLLNYFGLGKDVVEFIVDRSTYKQGRFMPGVHVPIYAPQKLLEAKPDYCLLLTWNFAPEILEQQREYRQAGGQFIIPIPDVRTV
jgi:hypothetical protein